MAVSLTLLTMKRSLPRRPDMASALAPRRACRCRRGPESTLAPELLVSVLGTTHGWPGELSVRIAARRTDDQIVEAIAILKFWHRGGDVFRSPSACPAVFERVRDPTHNEAHTDTA